MALVGGRLPVRADRNLDSVELADSAHNHKHKEEKARVE